MRMDREEHTSRPGKIFFAKLCARTVLPVLVLLALFIQASAQKKNSCLDCHVKLVDQRLSAPAKLFEHDVHRGRGLSCNDCHGGDPNADTSEAAKDPRKGFLGKQIGRASCRERV